MAELGTFIDAHPWVTFGAFIVAFSLAESLGGLIRIRIGWRKEKP